MITENRTQFQTFLSAHTTLILATIDEDGRPQTAPLFYAETGDLHLVFISETKTDHARNIAHEPRVAGSIAADGQNWATIQGLQFEGICHRLSGEEALEAAEIYVMKFPFIQKNKILQLALAKVRYFLVRPTWMRLVDNTQGFGHKQESHFPR